MYEALSPRSHYTLIKQVFQGKIVYIFVNFVFLRPCANFLVFYLEKRVTMKYNIGVNKISELLNNPLCEFVLHVGKKRLVKRKEFEKYIEKTLEI